jgi:hypothetical protein
MNATNAKAKLAIHAIRLARFSSWKKIPKFNPANSDKGKNIVATDENGILYRGILKLA